MARLDTTLGTVDRINAVAGTVFVELDREPGNVYECVAISDPTITAVGEAGPEAHTHAITSRYTKGRRVAVTPLDGVADTLLVLGPVG